MGPLPSAADGSPWISWLKQLDTQSIALWDFQTPLQPADPGPGAGLPATMKTIIAACSQNLSGKTLPQPVWWVLLLQPGEGLLGLAALVVTIICLLQAA